MGEVYRARDSRLNRDVAIKVLPADVSNDPDRLRRFEQEARAASALNHPNILTVYDVGIARGHTLSRDPSCSRARRWPHGIDRPPAAAAQSDRLRPAARQGPRRRAREGDHPPRSQACERVRHRAMDASRSSTSASPSFFPRSIGAADDAETMTAPPATAPRRRRRHRRLHGARASARRRRRSSDPTSSRSARCCTRCSPAAGPSAREHSRRDDDGRS